MQASPSSASGGAPSRGAVVEGPWLEAPRKDGAARALLAGFLACGDSAQNEGPRAVLDAEAARLGVRDADFLAPAGDVRDAFSGRALSPELLRDSERLLAAGYEAARAAAETDSARAALDGRTLDAVVRAGAVLPLSLFGALEEAQSTVLGPLLDTAVERLEAADAIDGATQVDALLGRIGGAASDVAEPLRALLLQVLDVASGRDERLARLSRSLRSTALSRLLLAHPAARGESVARALAADGGPVAIASAAQLVASARSMDDPFTRAYLREGSPAERVVRGARIFGALWSRRSIDAAKIVASHLGGEWPARTPLPLGPLTAALPVAAQRAAFEGTFADAVDARAATVAAAAREAALEAALSSIEGSAPLEEESLVVAARAGAVLVVGGQGAAVAAQLAGAGAELVAVGRDDLALGAWAALVLAIARGAAARGANVVALYATLASIFARAPERVLAFGAAAPLLASLRPKILAAFGRARGAVGSETFARLDRERRIEELAQSLARLDAPSFVTASPASPAAAPGAAAASSAPPATSAATTPTSASRPASVVDGAAFGCAIEAVSGVDGRPPSRLGELARGWSGFEVLRLVLRAPLRMLGLRRDGRLEIYRGALAVEDETRFLGQRLRTRRREIPPPAVVRVDRIERAPTSLLVLGLVALVVLTWFGASVAFDGLAIGDGVLIGGGLGAIAVGLLVDFALYGLFTRARTSTRFALYLRGVREPVRFGIARADAERISSALRSLRIGVE